MTSKRNWRGRFRRYVAGDAPLATVFLHHMLAVGTLVNVATGLAALGALSLGYADWLALLIFLSPLPYNIVLSVAVWRSAAQDETRLAAVARVGVLIWFPIMLLI